MSPLPLARDPGCLGQLGWRSELPPNLDPKVVAERLAPSGFQARVAHPALCLFRNPEGHEVVYVPATGRVGLRLHYGVPEPQRREAAEALRDLLESVLIPVR